MTVPQETAGPRVAAVLEALAMQNVSGILRIAGDPSGVVYLDRGQLIYAESSWVPGLAARLRALLGSSPAVGELLGEGGSRTDRDLGEALLAGQYLPKTGIRALLKSVLIDAVIALTLPLADETVVTGSRFEESAEPHWARGWSAQRLEQLRPLAAKKAALLAPSRTGLTSPLELRDLSHPWAVIKREHWEVASRVNGTSSIRDIAVESGLPLHETIERAAYLIKKQMCVAKPPAPASSQQAVAFEVKKAGSRRQRRTHLPDAKGTAVAGKAEAADLADSGLADSDLAAAEPGKQQVRRRPESRRASGRLGGPEVGPAPGIPVVGAPYHGVIMTNEGDEDEQSPPSAEQLRRVLDGLRKLS
ncbi:MAG TPA: DUF4388 domain-containing protein [Streptosporangiaceae bacterium]|nr:DUF4388 domain-containing protein [Streptosporangiaceae bacterium]